MRWPATANAPWRRGPTTSTPSPSASTAWLGRSRRPSRAPCDNGVAWRTITPAVAPTCDARVPRKPPTVTMSLDWSVDHTRRRVTATLRKSTTEQELYEFLGELIGEGAMAYPKIFDAGAATQWINPARIGPIAATARLYSRMGLGPVGPL